MQIIFTNCILCIAFYTTAFGIHRYCSLQCTFFSYLGDCDILLTKYDFCVHPRFEALGDIFEMWFMALVLKQWDEWLSAHSSTWGVIEKGEIHVHG